MALAVAIVSEDKNTYVVAFDGQPQISDVVDAIKDKMRQEGIMRITEWSVGFNYPLGEDYGKDLLKAINKID